jgi:periplasmic copper chaperone A
MTTHRRTLLALAVGGLALATAPARAHDYTLGELRIGHPWTRATAGTGASGGGFLTIRNTGSLPDRLLRAESAAAGVVELHTHINDQGVMRMRPVPDIPIPPGAEVKLAPGGLHVMFIDTRQRFDRGAKVPVTLVFERAGRIEVEMQVEAAGARGSGHHGH